MDAWTDQKEIDKKKINKKWLMQYIICPRAFVFKFADLQNTDHHKSKIFQKFNITMQFSFFTLSQRKNLKDYYLKEKKKQKLTSELLTLVYFTP